MEYYVYMYLNQDHTTFYIGEGSGFRWRLCQHRAGDTHDEIRSIGVDNVEIKFLHKNLTEEQAFYLEEYYIAGYGRRDIKTGILTNNTSGGAYYGGRSGWKHTEETKQKMRGRKVSGELREKLSASNKDQIPWNRGKNWADEIKQKISETLKGNQNAKGHIYKPIDETKRKISETMIKIWKIRKQSKIREIVNEL